MADHNEVAYTTADGNDYPAHEQTYEGFIMLVKYGTAAVDLHRRPDGDLPDLIDRLLRRHAAVRSQNLHRIPVAKPVSIASGNNASLLARACLAPPEAP